MKSRTSSLWCAGLAILGAGFGWRGEEKSPEQPGRPVAAMAGASTPGTAAAGPGIPETRMLPAPTASPASGSLGEEERRSIGGQIREARLWFTPRGGQDGRGLGFMAGAEGQQFSLEADGRGVVVRPWAAGWTWSVECETAPGTPSADRGRWVNRRADGVEEWLVNRADAPEHGFTLNQQRKGEEQTISMALRFGGGLKPRLAPDARSLHFRDEATGAYRLSYSSLTVKDAAQRPLPARFELEGPDRARIIVAAAGAQYPVVIDPVITAFVSKLTVAAGEAGDLLGNAVAVAGSFCVVGAPLADDGATANEGAAYIFTRSTPLTQSEGVAVTPWQLVKTLRAADGAASDQFGTSVAIAGDLIAVGSLLADTSATEPDTGAVYLFGRHTGGLENWGQFRKLTGSSGRAGGRFGASLAMTRTRVLVGAPYENVGSDAEQGTAYLFGPDDPTVSDVWDQVRRMTAADGAAGDHFGDSVALTDDHAVIGAPRENTGGNDAGAAYVFDRSAGLPILGGWDFLTKLEHTTKQAGDLFGNAVAIHGTDIVVGASGRVVGPTGNTAAAGAAWLFRNFALSQQFTPANPRAADGFGGAVAMDGSKIVVGAVSRDVTGSGSGALFVYEQNALGSGNFTLTAETGAPDAVAGDLLGGAVAMEGETIVAGARGFDGAGGANTGAAYVFARSSLGWVPMMEQSIDPGGEVIPDDFGTSMAMEKDALVVGCPLEDFNGLVNAGGAYVFQRDAGGSDRWRLVKRLEQTTSATNGRLGTAVALRGNILVVGGASTTGSISTKLYQRSADMADDWKFVKNIPSPATVNAGRYGAALAVGHDWFAVGEPDTTLGGVVHVFGRDTGGAGQWGLVRSLINPAAAGSAPGDGFGSALAGVDDWLLVGAPTAEVTNIITQTNGKAYFFQRHRGGLDAWNLASTAAGGNSLPGGSGGHRFGAAVSLETGWAVIGVPGNGLGTARVFARNEDGEDAWGAVATLAHPRSLTGHFRIPPRFGESVSVSHGRIAVGAPDEDFGGLQSGGVYLFERNKGGRDDFDLTAEIHQREPRGGAGFGAVVALDQSTLGVGIPEAGISGSRGSIAVFQEQLSAWRVHSAQPTGAGNAGWGRSLAMDGGWLLAGAPLEDVSGTDSGAAYLFERNRGGADAWGLVKKLTPPGAAANQQFGYSCDLEGGVALVGSDGVGGFIFGRNAGGADVWGHSATLFRDETFSDPNEFCGQSVALAGENAFIGDPGWAIGSANSLTPYFGAVHVFGRQIGGVDNWGFIKTLAPQGTGGNHRFGESLAADGDLVVIGASGSAADPARLYFVDRNEGGANNWGRLNFIESPYHAVSLSGHLAAVTYSGTNSSASGGVRFYERNSINQFALSGEISQDDVDQAQDGFGSSVALAGGHLAVGDTGTNAVAGRVHFFQRNLPGPGRWGQTATFIDPDNTPAAGYGIAVAMDGTWAAAGAQQAARAILYRLNRTPYEVWLRAVFSDIMVNNPAVESTVWGPLADPDGDGLPNIMEAYAGFDPETPTRDQVIQSTIFSQPNQTALIRWREAKNPHGTLAHFEWSPDLITWYAVDSGPDNLPRSTAFNIVESGPDHVIREARLPLVLSDARLYIRLKVQVQGL